MKIEFSKLVMIIYILIAFGTALIGWYICLRLDSSQYAVLTTFVGGGLITGTIGLFTKSTIENIFKYNDFKFIKKKK